MFDQQSGYSKDRIDKRRIRNLALSGYILLLSVVLARILFRLFGFNLVTAMYEGKSAGFLNNIISGQAEWALGDYLFKAERLSVFFFKSGLWAAVGLLVAALGHFLILKFKQTQSKTPLQPWSFPGFHSLAFLKRDQRDRFDAAERAVVAVLSLVFVAMAWDYFFIRKIPFWFYWDPDTSYFMDGLNLLLNGRVNMAVHPGVPCQYVIAVVLAPVHWYCRLRGIDTPEFCVEHIGFLTGYVGLVFAALMSWGIYLAAIAVKRLVPQTGMAVLACLVFLAAGTVTMQTLHSSPDTLLILVFGIWMALLARIETETDPTVKNKYFSLWALVSGAALAVKVTAFPLMVAVLLLSPRNWRGIVFSGLGFFLGILPVLGDPHSFARIVKSVVGGIRFNDAVSFRAGGSSVAGQYAYNTAVFIRDNSECLAGFALFLIILSAVFCAAKKEKPHWFPLNILFLASAIGFLVGLRYPGGRLLLPQLLLLLTSGMLALGTMGRTALKGAVLFLIVPAFFFAQANLQKTSAYLVNREEMCLRSIRLVSDILEDPRKPVIASAEMDMYLGPFALLLANYDSGALIAEPLKKRYPQQVGFSLSLEKEVGYDGTLRPLRIDGWEYIFYDGTKENAEGLRRILSEEEFKEIRRDPLTRFTVIQLEGRYGQR